ncbi:MAG: RNA methyltransferase [Ruminococcaceae bacterium]|nr:RNA methyltransferase [Oscillospiraceae bacterium]
MKVQKILSKDAAYQKLEVLKTNRNKRYRYGEFLVEGVRNINEAVAKDWEIVSWVYAARRQLSDWAKNLLRTVPTSVNLELVPALMDEISGKEDASEMLAIVKMKDDADRDTAWLLNALQLSADRPPLLALFDRPSNRGNLGTIIRSLDALGADGLILTGHGVDLYDPDVVVSTMGSFFALPVVRVPRHDALAALFEAIREKWGDLQVLGTTAHADTALWQVDLKKPTVFMIGCETDGLSEGLKPLCTEMITIPMAETSYASSFNVACAATVMFYEAVKQRSL